MGLVLVVGILDGCKGKKEPPLVVEIDDKEGGGIQELTDKQDGLPDLDVTQILFDRFQGLKAVYFDFDSSSLRPDALATLRSNADKIKKTPGVLVQVAGHCDERGTQEYNLALGERRALSVREHLIRLGVSGDRLITISYGEEFPATTGSSESAWSQNRRCEFNRAQSR